MNLNWIQKQEAYVLLSPRMRRIVRALFDDSSWSNTHFYLATGQRKLANACGICGAVSSTQDDYNYQPQAELEHLAHALEPEPLLCFAPTTCRNCGEYESQDRRVFEMVREVFGELEQGDLDALARLITRWYYQEMEDG